MQRKNQLGSIVFNRRSQTWRLFVYDAHGKRRTKTIGTRRELPTRTAARLAARTLCEELLRPPVQSVTAESVAQLVEKYRAERMPTRYSTRRGYEVWLRCYVLPRWGSGPITNVQPREVEMWLSSLSLAPKSKAEVRSLLGRLWEFAMWSSSVPTQRNPMQLVTVRGSSKRVRQPRSLTVGDFRQFASHLREPFHTIALLCVSLGLRISECLALKWSDVDWLGAKLTVQRGIVRNRVGDCKTVGSDRALFLSAEMLEALKRWKQMTEFSDGGDWVFASPSKLGRLPWSYDSTLREFQKAAVRAGIGAIGTHSLRHSFRSWLDSVGVSVAVQQKLMRHADVRTTMNQYGTVFDDAMTAAAKKVAALVSNSTPNSTHTV